MRPVCLHMCFQLLILFIFIISIEYKLIDLIKRTLQRECSPYLACNDRNAFFTSEKSKQYHAWSCRNVCDAQALLLDNILYILALSCIRQFVGIPMGTYHCSLVVDLFLFSDNSEFMLSLSDDKQAGIIDAFSTTSRYLDDILNMNNIYLTIWQEKIYPAGLQRYKTSISEIEAFFDLHLAISNDSVSAKWIL